MQLDLFGLAPPSSPIVGQHVRLERVCACGSNVAIVGSSRAMHAAGLSCASCHRFVGWLPGTTAQWLTASVSILRRVSRSLAQFLSCCI